MMGYISKGHKRHVWCARGVGGQPPPAALQVLRVKVRVVELTVGGGKRGRRYRFGVGSIHAQTPHGYRQTDRSTCDLGKP